MSDESPNVTFVGGKAVEQHDSLDSNVDQETRDEAKEAVREAIRKASEEAKEGAEKASKQDPYRPEGAKNKDDEPTGKSPVSKKPAGKPETPERGPDGKFLPKEGKDANKDDTAPDESDDATSLKQLLKHRQNNAQPKKEAQDRLAKEREQLAQETRKVQELYAQIQAEQNRINKERERYERLRKDPASAIREIGWEPEQFIVDLARDGTPEGQMARQQRELQQQLQEMKQWKEQQAQAQLRAQEEAQWQQQVNYRQHIEKTFLEDALHEENRPHTHDFYKGRENALLSYADLIAAQYRDLSGGKEASLKEVADFIEEELAERANAWYEKKSGTKKVSVSPEAKPGKGSKGKSLTPDAASEKRSLGRKALKDLDEEERRAAAKEAVAAAIDDSD